MSNIYQLVPDVPGFALRDTGADINATIVEVVYRDSTGTVIATPFRLWRDEQGLWEFDRPGVPGSLFRTDPNGKIQEKA